ncbi:MBL fold metallo-hydrolase [Silvibacterium acidisoli]|uniref:MBL fold metallo-hydrolase n=1 Tax=Acidobacteriaceae bacterium ZG23-2 TaxID=2883246 RepID=UPI00406C7DBA
MTLLHPARRTGKHFQNPIPTDVGSLRVMLDTLPRYLSNKEETKPKSRLGPFHTDRRIYNEPPVSGLRVTWFGHSSSLIEIDGLRVLVDPVWERRAAPFEWVGPERFFAPTIALEELPPLDAVLISHDHYDHLGRRTIARLSRMPALSRTRWVTGLGVGKLLGRFGVPAGRITELDWTQNVTITGENSGAELTINCVPSRHFSGRTLGDRFTTLWGSYVLEGSSHRVFYGADSGPWPGFAEIGAKYGPFDLTMLEIGAYDAAWASIHLGPDAAADAYASLGGAERAGLLMPIHWGLFNLALHGWRQPIDRMTALAAERGLPLWSPLPGQPTEPAEPFLAAWWQKR